MCTRSTILWLILLALVPFGSAAQTDDRVAYVPARPPERTADREAIGIHNGALAGLLDVDLPAGTHRVDLLNARGRVKQAHEGAEVHQLDLASLSPGTWTLRAHTPEGCIVRRFVVIERGRIAWAVPQAPRSTKDRSARR